MEEKVVVSLLNEAIYTSTKILAVWLNKMLPKICDDWWKENVLLNLSFAQRENILKNNIDKLEQLDLAALLRIADKSWYDIREFAYLPSSERECIRNMQKVRNNWAHCSGTLPGKDAILSDLDTIILFFKQFNAPSKSISDIELLKEKIRTEGLSQQKATITETNVAEIVENNEEIKEKSMVYLVGDPSTKGMVFSIEDLGQTKKYLVFVDGELKTYFSGQIALIDNKPSYNMVDLETFQSYLTAYQINNPSSYNLYSLNSARIDFVPYQFRPALKIIKADEPRILIADSVGVGKTIEAGLIIKELEARNELENILIICPKPLITEKKWEDEMKRFDEDFIPLDGKTLRMALSETDRDGEWPVRYSKAIIPYSILDELAYNGGEGRRHREFGLNELDPAPHFDLVIVDEAHHIRNGSMEKEKAFAYKCVKYFCDHADAVVMLTATPLQTSDDNLFTLLNILRPDFVIDKSTFGIMSRPNAFISKCAQIIRSASDGWQKKALEELQNVRSTQWGEDVISKNPLYAKICELLSCESVSREERVQLISDVESLHSFNSMINRTRRKDIQDFCIRRTHTLETEFTPAQKELHDELIRFEYAALSRLHDVRSIPFMISTLRRQAASCIFGLAPYFKDLVERRLAAVEGETEFDADSIDINDNNADILEKLGKRMIELAENLPDEDPKIESIIEIVREKQSYDNNKIILFSSFRRTLDYVEKKLSDCGFRVAQINGGVKDDTRWALRQRFEKPKDDPDALDILLFTEVGSEGLDYQFCNLMINYDLPWNPMRIEQRIGRIDRRGQKSDVVNIYNTITAGTVDADIYERCLLRIGVFERSIGECESILGEIGAMVERIALDTTLTDNERKTKLEQMADNEIRKMQELVKLEDEEKELFGFDLSSYTASKEIRDAESCWLTTECIRHLVERYLVSRIGKTKCIIGDGDVKTLRLSATARELLKEDYKKLSGVRSSVNKRWERYLKGINPNVAITFESEAGSKDKNAFLIAPTHPLVRQAAQYFANSEMAFINIKYCSDSIKPGQYPFSVYAWRYTGVNSKVKIVPVCTAEGLTNELPDIIQTASDNSTLVSVNSDTWRTLEDIHVRMWAEARSEHIQNVNITANYKLESIANNYRNRKLGLEQRINDNSDANICRMYQAELEAATEKYELKVQEIEREALKADIHVSLIANGIVNVERA